MTDRPWVTLKLATSLDGRIATAAGESRWITGEAAREQVHRLRAEHDAVLVGVDTALADDPELTVRLAGGSGRKPLRVVLDSRQRLAPSSKLARSARETPTWVVSVEAPRPELATAGVRVLTVASVGGRPDLDETMMRLAGDGIERLFVEGGGQVAASFLRGGFVDAIEWFRAPILLGGEGRPAVGALGLESLSDAPKFRRAAVAELGADLWERYERI